MTWRNHPGEEPEQRFHQIEKEFGLQNLQDVQIDETNNILYIFTQNKKYSIGLTEV